MSKENAEVGETVKDVSNSAKYFLEGHNLAELIPELVEKNGFKEIADLHLLCDDLNVVKCIGLPVLSVLKLKKALKQHNSQAGSGKKKELSKRELLQLAKSSIEAKVANLRLNRFNALVGTMLEKLENEWQGDGRLNTTGGTTRKDVATNKAVCFKICEDAEIKALMGLYNIEEKGVITIDSKRVMRHVSAMWAQKRKPSAYQKLSPEQKKASYEKAVKKRKMKAKEKVKRQKGNDQSPEQKKVSYEKAVKRKMNAKEKVKRQKRNDQQTDSSKNESIVEEGIGNIVQAPNNQAVIVALFWLKAKRLSSLNVSQLRNKCKELSVAHNRTDSKEEICKALGRALYERKIMRCKLELKTQILIAELESLRNQLNAKDKECNETKKQMAELLMKNKEAEAKSRVIQNSLKDGLALQNSINQKNEELQKEILKLKSVKNNELSQLRKAMEAHSREKSEKECIAEVLQSHRNQSAKVDNETRNTLNNLHQKVMNLEETLCKERNERLAEQIQVARLQAEIKVLQGIKQ